MTERYFLTAALAVILLSGCEDRVRLGPGIKAPDAPLQAALPTQTIEAGTFVLEVRASYLVKAKLLSKRRYRFDDLSDVIPWDFALGWGVVSDEAQLRNARVTQGDRKMYWHLSDTALDLAEVERSSANTHLIPATPEIAEALALAPEGAIVTLEGRLVDVIHEDGKRTPTSLTRDDLGVGACEILWIERFTVENPGASDHPS